MPNMTSTLCFLLPLIALAIALDIFLVRGWQRFRALKTQMTDEDGVLKISRKELWALAFFPSLYSKMARTRFRTLKKEMMDEGGIPKLSRGELWTRAFFPSTHSKKARARDKMAGTTDTHARIKSTPWPRMSAPFHLRGFALEWLLIILLAYVYSGKTLLNFDAAKLQQTGEHNESATLPLLAEIGLWRYGEVPLWNPYMLAGFPHVGDFVNHFWNPISTIPILLWGGINGMKVSIFLTFIIAGLGQWMFAYVIGLRRTFRLWSSILFMISGGLALLWRVGWYELLLGTAWFPWCFALYWRALHDHRWTSIGLCSAAIFMVISTGGGYYPIYLFVSLGVLTCIALLRRKTNDRTGQIRTATLIMVSSLALSAVIIIPYLDAYRYTARDAPLDTSQFFSQPISYGLINYIVYTPDWFRANVLGTASGWNWFYIGWLPIAALAFVPLAFSRSFRQRWSILLSGVLFLILLMWFANRFSPFRQIYDWIPFLYTFRFPNRLLVIATSPLLILSALALEYTYRASRVGVRNIKLVSRRPGKGHNTLPVHYLVKVLWIVGLIATTKTVYDVNKGFAFVDQSLNPKTFAVLNWLKSYDPTLYYVNIGGGVIYWDWTPAAYTLEMPVLNFQYNRHLLSQDQQRSESSPFFARAKYQISLPDQPPPENAQLLRDFEGLFVWYAPDTLPYAFSVRPERIQAFSKLTVDQVSATEARINGPNEIIVKGSPRQEGDVLVVLASNYPGWKLLIDDKPARITPYNGYLGAEMLPGQHSYTFYFLPAKYIIGATISSIALILLIIGLLAVPLRMTMTRFRNQRQN
jgi:hypothetical protein